MEINKDTKICLSISARPSNFGTRFHNYLYQELGLNFLYKGCAVSDLEGAVRGIRALGIRGSAVSMPHKETVMQFLDAIDPEAEAIGAVNTIVNDEGRLTGYNTDYLAAAALLARIPQSTPTVLLGSGGMAKALAHALDARDYTDVTVVARNEATGLALAEKYGFRFASKLPLDRPAELLINATPIGMSPDPGHTLSFPETAVERANYVMDSVAVPSETALIRAARAKGKRVFTGFDIVALQAVEQFRLYTGVELKEELYKRAAAHAQT